MAPEVTFLGLLSPLAATALGWLALDQELTAAQALGGLVVLAALVAAQAQNTHSARPRRHSTDRAATPASTPCLINQLNQREPRSCA